MRPVERLTDRDMELLEWLVEGFANRQIAECMGASVQVTKNRVSNIFGKTGMSSRGELALYALQKLHIFPRSIPDKLMR